MPTLLQVEDVPPKTDGCRHNHALREAVIDAVLAWWTPQRIASIKTAIADAAGTTADKVSNKMVMRALHTTIEERQGGTD